MKVKLISYTQPSEEFLQEIDKNYLNIKDLIVYCARVSNKDNQNNFETSDKLIDYLIQHKHWSPFEMVNVCLEIEVTRDIARQLLRHRSFSFQEFSQRYSDDLSFVTREARLQDQKNRQNSIEIEDKAFELAWRNRQMEVISKAKEVYQWAIDNGIAKEVARAVLPEGNTMSKLYVNGSIRSWIHYIDVRTHKDTQKEHREMAKLCAEVIANVFDNINNFKH
jgi:thymidylate synthase (FAD)